jgi:hypothetical protein
MSDAARTYNQKPGPAQMRDGPPVPEHLHRLELPGRGW